MCVVLAEAQHGLCPVCGWDIATEDGLIVGHGRWQVTRDGVESSDEPCAGAGQVPEVGG
ncbi:MULTISPECIES: hypothetical protein [unclassified Actinoplanes]|uniref:hypothetical protein n=1 Tax=unclassified Actinoplanes TaxID=2626549 RepID=UPI0003051472|nr:MULTISPECIES: hypothetical protein [unclassified Actinoplanes]